MGAMIRFNTWALAVPDTDPVRRLKSAVREMAEAHRRVAAAHIAWSKQSPGAKAELIAACAAFVEVVAKLIA